MQLDIKNGTTVTVRMTEDEYNALRIGMRKLFDAARGYHRQLSVQENAIVRGLMKMMDTADRLEMLDPQRGNSTMDDLGEALKESFKEVGSLPPMRARLAVPPIDISSPDLPLPDTATE